MIVRVLLGIWGACALVLAQNTPTGGDPSAAQPAEVARLTGKYTSPLVLAPTAEGGVIARLVASLLERSHYSQHPLDDEISRRFFDRYLEVMDPQRMYLLQSDARAFEKYRNSLDELIRPSGPRTPSDIRPAYEMFNRFLERFDQQYAFVMDLLDGPPMTFDTSEDYPTSRKDEPRPKTLDEARKLWRDRLRYEYLAEKLNQPTTDRLQAAIWNEILVHDAKLGSADRTDASLKVGAPIDWSTFNTNRISTNQLGTLVGRDRAIEWYQIVATNVAVESGKLRLPGTPQGGSVDLPLTSAIPPAFAAFVNAKLEKDRAADIRKTLIRRYNRTLRTLKQYDSDEVLQLYLDALCHAYDPHSDYFGRAATENFSISMSLSLFGIGATLQSEDGYTVIRSIVPGSPAEKSKQLKVNDKIVGVAQGDSEMVDVMDERLDKVVQQIRGAKGTRVRLNVVPGDSPDPSARKVVSLVRDEIKLEDQEAKSKLIELPDAAGKMLRLGVIDLPSFYADFPTGGQRRSQPKSTTRDVAKLLTKLKQEKVDGVILDLRRNGGGSLEESVKLAGLFIKQGPIVQVRNAGDPPSVAIDEDNDPSILYDGPLIVLTSRFSASASEIVAGALQDYGRAVIVGDSSTHGKGTVQTLQELSQYTRAMGLRTSGNPGSTKITIRKFYRANGASTQLKGVIPDVILPSVNNHLEVGESSLTNALPWDTIPSANFTKVNAVNAALPELLRRSRERVSKDRDFDYIREDIERFLKQRNDKVVSLNEATRRKEQEESKARAEARKKEILARNEKLPTTYEITLKAADQPGLPPPVAKTNIVAVSRADKQALDRGTAAAGKSSSSKGSPSSPAKNETDKPAEVKSDTAATPAPKSTLDDDEEPKPDDLDGVAADVPLKEAERVLADLIALTSGKAGSVSKFGNP